MPNPLFEPFEEVVGVFHKTPDGEVRVSVGRGKNRQGFFSVRKFWLPPGSATGEMVPTKRGVRMHAEVLKEVIAALQKGDEILEKRGT